MDDRQLRFPLENGSLISSLCERRLGIGADGLILLQPSQIADYRMRYFNADGKEVELCGNGLRCFVAFVNELGDYRTALMVETASGCIACRREGGRISSCFPEPQFIREPFPLALFSGIRDVYFVRAGVPHVVLFSDNLEEEELPIIGREIRHHPAFLPEGANVNFLEWKGGSEVRIRTYERGVEAETMACGTGALATAKVIASLKRLERITITPRSQECIEVNTLTWELTGPAKLVFEGTVFLTEPQPDWNCLEKQPLL